MTLKESINVRGLRTTAGMPFWKDVRSEHDAPVTTRVKGAGAVVMAKTNVPQMLADWQSNNPVYGRTNNPWDLTRTPGGSTGGGACALATGLTPLEFGSDIGGSIRVPAAFCGVYGHRPSETAMPRSGQFPFPPLPNAAVVMGVQDRWGDRPRISRSRWTSRPDPSWGRMLVGIYQSLLLDAGAWPSFGWLCCRRSSGCPSTRRSPPRWTAWPRGSDGSAAGSRGCSRTCSAIIGSTTRSTSRCWPPSPRPACPPISAARGSDVMRTRDDEWSRALRRGIESGAPDYVAWGAQRERYARPGGPSSASGTFSWRRRSSSWPIHTGTSPGRTRPHQSPGRST